MPRRYTAQEMRELAEMIDHGGAFALTDPSIIEANIVMLRQAADMMGREVKYEYAAQYFRRGKCVGRSAGHYTTLDVAKRNNTFCTSGEELRFVRREVGEWKEVK